MKVRVHHVAATVGGLFALGLMAAGGASAQDQPLPDGPGKAELAGACTVCHGTGQITAQHRSADEWKDVMTRMVGFGAAANDEQQQQILAYLNTNFGKGDATAATAPAATPAPDTVPAPEAPPARPQ